MKPKADPEAHHNNNLDKTAPGRRLQLANTALEAMADGQLAALRDFVFDAAFDVREIVDLSMFGGANPHDSDIQALEQASALGTTIRTGLANGRPRFTLYHTSEPSELASSLYAKSFSCVAALSYATIGLDMTGLIHTSGANKARGTD